MGQITEILRRVGGPFVLMGVGFLLAFVGLGDDWYQHEVVGFSPALESFYAPVHLLIFGGVIVAALGYVWGLVRLVSSMRRIDEALATSFSLTKPSQGRR